ncbi:substrate-binding domain-containing protein [Aromatoleum petrolei]|uniref:LysR family transcriptional regulator n=1 Tax=Aromatoleum petrolei TaxID=76116 RepID=A0ABX1MHB4_9RHOO|nr:substrate-binding domain-containing protein [Aromatoleum petrolei]NMF87332.1 LysR family transcriptional regulator [Aromatoleum petrolei]QTQ38579.1 Transcriptional regulator, LysR family [Aromatoleum petrolei]
MPKEIITIEPSWRFRNAAGQELDPLLFRLLRAINESGKLTAAAEQVGYSYRHCWNLIHHWSAFFGVPLVTLSKGRGARLTPLGEKLAWAAQLVEARLNPQLQNLAVEIHREIGRALSDSLPTLRLHASQGFAVELLPELFAEISKARLELVYLGSVEAMASMARGNCELCGFHLPKSLPAEDLLDRYGKFLKPRTHRLIRLVTRTQGLFLAAGNPLGIRSIADLTGPEVRFVNRQPNSGTRILFDLLLSEAGVKAEAVVTYEQIEYTHSAVAAFVASGMADAGFGVETAASRFKLDFLPLAQETYFLACRHELLAQPAVQDLLTVLRSPVFAQRIVGLPGYDAQGAGDVLRVDSVFERSSGRPSAPG